MEKLEKFLIGFVIGAVIGYVVAVTLNLREQLMGRADPHDPLGATAAKE